MFRGLDLWVKVFIKFAAAGHVLAEHLCSTEGGFEIKKGC